MNATDETPTADIAGAYTERSSSPLAQELVPLKAERRVGFTDGASPNTTLFSLRTHKSVLFC